LHLCLTLQHINMADEFLQDLKEAVAKVQESPDLFKEGGAAIYGLAATIPDRSVVVDVAHMFLDTMLDCPE
jgi:sphinganine-1-phosphate aldolase